MSFLRHIITPSVLALIFCAPWAQAQSWPTRPVRIIVPFAPGSTMESVVRTLAPELTRALGQPILVENKPGAGTVVGVDAAAKSAPDGYTFVSVANSFTVNATLVPKLPYDTLKDLQPVILTARTANVLVAHPSVSANTLREFVALAKQQPGRLTYASFGNGTTAHFAGEILKTMATIDIVHVPYKGQGPALGDVLAGQVNAMFCNLPDCLPHVRAGKLKAYGTTYAERAALAPDLPTIAEQGYPGFYTDSWYGLMAPTGVSRDIIQRMNNVILRSIGEGEIREAFIKRGLDPLGGTSERFGEHLRSEIAKYAKVVKDAQMKID